MEGSGRKFPRLIKEELHYSVYSGPGGKFLFHFVPEEAAKERSYLTSDFGMAQTKGS